MRDDEKHLVQEVLLWSCSFVTPFAVQLQ